MTWNIYNSGESQANMCWNTVYHSFRQMWLVLGVKLMEINAATCFPGTFLRRYYWWFRNRKANQQGCIWDLFSIAGFQLPFPQLVMFAETTILHQVIQFVTKLHPWSLEDTFSTISKGHGISPGPKEGHELNHQVMIWFIIKLKPGDVWSTHRYG